MNGASTHPNVFVRFQEELQVAAEAQHLMRGHAVNEHVQGAAPLLDEVSAEAELLCTQSKSLGLRAPSDPSLFEVCIQ